MKTDKNYSASGNFFPNNPHVWFSNFQIKQIFKILNTKKIMKT